LPITGFLISPALPSAPSRQSIAHGPLLPTETYRGRAEWSGPRTTPRSHPAARRQWPIRKAQHRCHMTRVKWLSTPCKLRWPHALFSEPLALIDQGRGKRTESHAYQWVYRTRAPRLARVYVFDTRRRRSDPLWIWTPGRTRRRPTQALRNISTTPGQVFACAQTKRRKPDQQADPFFAMLCYNDAPHR